MKLLVSLWVDVSLLPWHGCIYNLKHSFLSITVVDRVRSELGLIEFFSFFWWVSRASINSLTPLNYIFCIQNFLISLRVIASFFCVFVVKCGAYIYVSMHGSSFQACRFSDCSGQCFGWCYWKNRTSIDWVEDYLSKVVRIIKYAFQFSNLHLLSLFPIPAGVVCCLE